MDLKRAFVAIILSFLILIGYQYFFVHPAGRQPVVRQQSEQVDKSNTTGKPTLEQKPSVQPAAPSTSVQVVQPDPAARDITVETPRYSAVINEQGGGFKSFVLKQYSIKKDKNSGLMQMVGTENPVNLPVIFTLDNGAAASLPVYHADRKSISLSDQKKSARLVMTATLPQGIRITRTLTFDAASYLIGISYQVQNTTDGPLQVSPALALTNVPFAHTSSSSRYMFRGPAAYVNTKLAEVKAKKFKDSPYVLTGAVTWAAYEDNYFISALIPLSGTAGMVTISDSGQQVRTVVTEGRTTLAPRETREFKYNMYFGPKKLLFSRKRIIILPRRLILAGLMSLPNPCSGF